MAMPQWTCIECKLTKSSRTRPECTRCGKPMKEK